VVGDKTSLLIAPIVAAAGLMVPMISGRSLGHTGGTLDKLETIPGFTTQLSLSEFGRIIAACGFAMAGQTPALVPADRILYSLRDHTGTVESPNLICASIMSKKLAEGLNALVLDVKTGSGAFMTRYEDAKHLASLMVRTGEAAGTRTVALLTSMDEPLGRFSGNWVEVRECVDILKNVRHPMSADLIELTNALAGWMLYLGGKAASPQAGAMLSDGLLTSGAAYRTWLEMVELQGGDISVFEDPASFHKPAASRVLTAETSGYLASMDCREVGWAVQRLGAGRLKPGDPVSAHAGIEVHAKLGSRIEQGQPLVTLFAEDSALLDEPYAMIRGTYCITADPPTPATLIREVLTAESAT
jgi:pyrimidine-nucleoside phosphorylase